MVLLVIVIAWMYVAVMMAVAEATHPGGTLLGAIFTFVLYGVGPVALLVYLMGRKARRAARARRDGAVSGPPDGSGEAAADAIPPVRKEP